MCGRRVLDSAAGGHRKAGCGNMDCRNILWRTPSKITISGGPTNCHDPERWIFCPRSSLRSAENPDLAPPRPGACYPGWELKGESHVRFFDSVPRCVGSNPLRRVGVLGYEETTRAKLPQPRLRPAGAAAPP